MCSGSEAGSYLRLIDSFKAHGPCEACNESKDDKIAEGSACSSLASAYEAMVHPASYRGISLIRNHPPLGPYRRPVPRDLGGSSGGPRGFLEGS